MGGVIVGTNVLYVPTEKGLDYHQRTEPNVLFYGGRGSAKSTTGRWDAHIRALAYPGLSYAILRRTFPELEKSHIRFIGREMKLLGGKYNHTLKKAYYPNGSTGFFSHCATEEDVLNLLSSEFNLMFFDEISTFDWDQVMKLAGSIREPIGSDMGALLRAATNPFGASAQRVMEYFVWKNVEPEDNSDYLSADWHSIRANLEDNPYLDQKQYLNRLKGSGLAEAVRKAWIDGEFSLENALFALEPMRGTKPYHVIHDIELDKVIKASTIYRCIDSGWFPDPTVVLWIAHLGNRHIVFHERVLHRHTAAETAHVIKQDEERMGISKVAMTYCDPSMDVNTQADVRTLKEIYEDHGIPMECSLNNREMFATALHTMLAEEAGEDTPRLQFFAHGRHEGCPYLVRTIPQMRYDEKHPERMADHREDHAVVALCYYIMSHASDQQRSILGTSKLRPWMRPKKEDRHILGNDQVRD